MSPRRLVVIGDALLDRDLEGHVSRLSPDAPVPVVEDPVETVRPGGAGLAAALAAADGEHVTLVTALAADGPGDKLRSALAAAGVDVLDLGLAGTTPEKVRVRTRAMPLLRLDRGGAPPGRVGAATEQVLEALSSAAAVLVADYGRGLSAEPGIRAALRRVAAETPVVWDPHPRGDEPVGGAAIVTPNAREAAGFAPEVDEEDGIEAAIARARVLRRRWGADNVCVTLAERGALIVSSAAQATVVSATPTSTGDPCGAGDRFASRAAALLGARADPPEAVRAAVAAATDFVAAGGAAAAMPARAHEDTARPADPVDEVLGRTRARGGTVVATGGCFDLLHAGHVRMLRAARRLGDCLIVCLNSDASVRRLKGPGRPIVDQSARAAVLEALESVDAVAVFGEATPEAVLERLRPDVFAKGGDYAGVELPEAAVLRRWGGEVVLLPYEEGRSTTGLIAQAGGRHAA